MHNKMAVFRAFQKVLLLPFLLHPAALGEVKLNIDHGRSNVCVSSSQSLDAHHGKDPRCITTALNPPTKEQQEGAMPVSVRVGTMCSPSSVAKIGSENFILHTDQERTVNFLITHEASQKLFITGNQAVDQKVAYALVLMNSGQTDQSLEKFTEIIKEHPKVPGAYFGRGTAYMRKGIQSKLYGNGAIADFTTVIKLSPRNPDGWIRRAEVYAPLGHLAEALSDINRALDLEPTMQLYLISGILLYMQENYKGAQEKLEKSLQMDKHQSTALLYLGLSLYHRGKLREAIEPYLAALKSGTNPLEAHRSLAHTHRDLGEIKAAEEHLTAALMLEPNNTHLLALRGNMIYMNGRPDEALEDFKSCLKYDPQNVYCQYYKGLGYAALGNFFEAVKSSTVVILNAPDADNAQSIHGTYLKEYSRYLHARLDSPLKELSPDQELDSRLRDNWVKSKPLNAQDYPEQPGIEPHIRELDNPSFADLSRDAQVLLCKAQQLGPRLQYHADGFTPNLRSQRAMGLAMLDVAQKAQKHWGASRSTKHKMTWKQIVDVAVKWRRIVDLEHPILWLDQMPAFETGYSVRSNLLSLRYNSYQDKLLDFVKRRLLDSYQVESLKPWDFVDRVAKAKTCHDLVRLLKADSTRHQMPALNLPNHVNSAVLNGRPILQGAMVLLAEDSKRKVIYTLDTASTPSRTAAFSAELEFIWNQLNEEVRKPGIKESDAIGTTVLSLAFYFFNMMPLARGTSAVAYTVALGLFLAVGKEATGNIPKGKQVDLEALIESEPSQFARQVKSWLALRKMSTPASSLPSVSETFSTLRMALEALNTKVTAKDCAETKSSRRKH